MKNQIIGKITSVELLREGEKNGRKWQMFKVKINDQEFISFDWGYKNKLNQEGTWTYEEKINEKGYTNKILENLPRPKPVSVEQFDALVKRVEALESQINFPQGEESGGHVEDVRPEDLPF